MDIDVYEKNICHECIGEKYLKKEILATGQVVNCSYCEEEAEGISMRELADKVDIAFQDHYEKTPEEPDSFYLLEYGDFERDGDPIVDVISDAVEISEESASDIQEILSEKHYDHERAKMGEESEFSSDSYYTLKSVNDAYWQSEWKRFEKSLKTEARYFNTKGEKYLASVFNGIDKMNTRGKKPIVVIAGPTTDIKELYRARVFQSEHKLETALSYPEQQIGTPPFLFAIAGRMNARGISVFYGANDPKVALAEVRPPVGSRVLVGRFKIIRSLKLLDLTSLSSIGIHGSIFDKTYAKRLEKAVFLRSLCERMTKPVMPDDEAFEYLVTQAIAEYLGSATDFDGIIFPSVQASGEGVNFVLFHKASKVKRYNLIEGTEISVRPEWDDDILSSYTVFEETPAPKPHKTTDDSGADIYELFGHSERSSGHTTDFDIRPETLELDFDSIALHKIKAVDFDTDEFIVRRLRCDKRKSSDVSDI